MCISCLHCSRCQYVSYTQGYFCTLQIFLIYIEHVIGHWCGPPMEWLWQCYWPYSNANMFTISACFCLKMFVWCVPSDLGPSETTRAACPVTSSLCSVTTFIFSYFFAPVSTTILAGVQPCPSAENLFGNVIMSEYSATITAMITFCMSKWLGLTEAAAIKASQDRVQFLFLLTSIIYSSYFFPIISILKSQRHKCMHLFLPCVHRDNVFTIIITLKNKWFYCFLENPLFCFVFSSPALKQLHVTAVYCRLPWHLRVKTTHIGDIQISLIRMKRSKHPAGIIVLQLLGAIKLTRLCFIVGVDPVPM